MAQQPKQKGAAEKSFVGKIDPRAPVPALKSHFDLFDKNSDGHLSKKEFISALHDLGIDDPDDVIVLFEFGDTNGDGDLSFQEFVFLVRVGNINIWKNGSKKERKERIQQLEIVRDAFNKVDIDGSHTMDRDELAKCLEGQDKDAIESQWLQLCDYVGTVIRKKKIDPKNKKTEISFGEWAQFILAGDDGDEADSKQN